MRKNAESLLLILFLERHDCHSFAGFQHEEFSHILVELLDVGHQISRLQMAGYDEYYYQGEGFKFIVVMDDDQEILAMIVGEFEKIGVFDERFIDSPFFIDALK